MRIQQNPTNSGSDFSLPNGGECGYDGSAECVGSERDGVLAVDVLIVGAGMAGLMAARTLKDRGHSVLLIEGGRSVGGRLATRRVGAGRADHGAQFFTVRTDALQSAVEQWLEQGLVYVWGLGWSDGSVKRTAGDGHPRYAVRGGMNRLAKHLAQGLDVVLERLVVALQRQDDGWRLRDSEGAVYAGRALLLTPPAPQALKLLDDSRILLQTDDFVQLRRIQFGPCLCGIHEIEGGAADLPLPGALQNFQSDVYWVADNQAKGISKTTVITSHANAKYSRQHWDASEADIIADLEAAVLPHLGAGARIVRTQLKKWHYSVPLTTHPQECLLAAGLPRLAFAGDAFGGRGRVEGAFMSGVAAGGVLAAALEQPQ